MNTNWYLVKVLPGKERQLTEEFNKQIEYGDIKSVSRFVCPTEKHMVVVRNKKMMREKRKRGLKRGCAIYCGSRDFLVCFGGLLC